ncbi:beta-ketoacyl-[acyl-carrier-protein] synthase family protein [Clostridium fungisolvens]|uniref:Ketosynthase family 3 (KS3) domain-containing protein n=1 Tax=Clostridium fungisolvens TaxID=1604897 RepID=A0A6V8SLG7_9CLOT|nr:beta-ketoacyl-[acyl-carrier-protein] synthase family protein [Clostridium fungisolvens]GFP77740.1 hypothetical protein bsdtw1_03911 [Clostridium fungisolvens]
MDNEKICVVTGLGVNCSIGNNLEEVWDNAVNGVSGIKNVKGIDTTNAYAKIGATAEAFKCTFKMPKRYTRVMDRTSILVIEAVNEAIKDSNLILDEENKERISVSIGSCTGGALSAEKFERDHSDNNVRENPNDILRIPVNCIARNVALFVGAEGVVSNISNACAAGNISIAYACDLIKRGQADVVIVGGTDAFASLPFAGFHALQALDKNNCSPFSRSQGISLGEGAGVLIIESLEHALERKARIYCKIAGYSVTGDSYHITAPKPDGESQIFAIKSAIAEAGIHSKDIDYLNAHGTGTPLNDAAELTSIKEIFYESKNHIKISSTKSMIGHCLGAASAIEAIISIKALNTSKIPPTINFDEEVENEFDFVPNRNQEKNLNIVMSNSFAFGGNNASVIFSKSIEKVVNRRAYDDEKVYITGMDCMTPIGVGINEYWSNSMAGKKGFTIIDSDSDFKSSFIADVKVDNFSEFGIKPGFMRKLDRLSKLLLISGVNALKNAGLEINKDIEKEIGLIVGTSDGPAAEIGAFIKSINSNGIKGGSALSFPNTVYNAAAGYLSIMSKIKGYTATIVNGVSSGMDSLCYGYDLLKLNRSKYMLISGVDEYSDTIHLLYDKLNSLYIGEEPDELVYGFKGNEFIVGEGSTSLLLETKENALKRGATLYAEIVGYGITNSPCKPGRISLDGKGLEKAIIKACENAGIALNVIDAIVGFANGSSIIDKMELRCYKNIFKEKLNHMNIHTVKNMVGEGRAATSALQIAHAALMLYHGQTPITRKKIDTDINIDDMTININEKENGFYRYVLVTSFSFGGGFSAVILKNANL